MIHHAGKMHIFFGMKRPVESSPAWDLRAMSKIGLTARELRVRSTRLDEVGGPSKPASRIFVVQPSHRPSRSTRRRRSPIEQRRWRAAGSATALLSATKQLCGDVHTATSITGSGSIVSVPNQAFTGHVLFLEDALVNQEFNITLCCVHFLQHAVQGGAKRTWVSCRRSEFTIYGSLGTWCTSLLLDMSKHESCIWELFRCPCAGFMWSGGSDGRASLSSPRLVASGGGRRPELSVQPLLSSIIRRTTSRRVIISNLDVMAAFKVPRTATEALQSQTPRARRIRLQRCPLQPVLRFALCPRSPYLYTHMQI
ncbi:unnamed protein product [Musa acuminata var. zebrina]